MEFTEKPQSSISTHPVLMFLRFFENLFSPSKRGGENYDLLYQNSIEKYEDDWFIYILYNTKNTLEKIATLMKGDFL